MKVFCLSCKYYENGDQLKYKKLAVLPPLHSCTFSPSPKIDYTETPILVEKVEDVGWDDCLEKNKKNNCKDFKKTIW